MLLKYWGIFAFLILLSGCRYGSDKDDISTHAILSEVIDRIKNDYVEVTSQKEILEDALQSVVSHLDEYSIYLPPDQYNKLFELTKGEFAGVGLEIIPTKKGFKVISAIEGTPAFKAHITTDDIITHIDDVDIRKLTTLQAAEKISGSVDSIVKLTIARKGKASFSVKLKREKVEFNPVRYKILENNIGYIKLVIFSERAGAALEDALKKLLQNKKLKGFILDLRNNPGGTLEQAVQATSLFLPEKLKVVEIRGRNKKYDQVIKSDGSDVSNGKPLIVLVNAGSASGSEVLAGALQDHKRAIIVGEKSFGKGSVQSFFELKNIGGMKLTIAHFFTPKGKKIQGQGIMPDIIVKKRKSKREDVVLKKAIQRLKKDQKILKS